jgi:hypothetical protein
LPVVALARRTRLCHAYFAPINHLAIQTTDGFSRALVRRHFDEAEPSGPTTHSISDDSH